MLWTARHSTILQRRINLPELPRLNKSKIGFNWAGRVNKGCEDKKQSHTEAQPPARSGPTPRQEITERDGFENAGMLHLFHREGAKGVLPEAGLVCANPSRKTKDQHRTKPCRASTDYHRTRSGGRICGMNRMGYLTARDD